MKDTIVLKVGDTLWTCKTCDGFTKPFQFTITDRYTGKSVFGMNGSAYVHVSIDDVFVNEVEAKLAYKELAREKASQLLNEAKALIVSAETI